MEAWWEALTALNKGFFLAALFFSVLFVWQIVSMLIGLDMHGNGDAGHGGFAGHGHADVGGGGSHHVDHELGGEVTFTLVSVRSVIAFATLFSWAGALYLFTGTSPILAISLAAGWGLAAMFGVSFLVYKLLKLQEVGTVSLWTATGEEGFVYMDIPADGAGKVRIKVGGVVSFVDARSGGGAPLKAGTPVLVSRVIDSRTVEVVPFDSFQGE
ncbi:MAG: hypothetical protein AB1733_15765 [Thermodesulfobacteriota bacterium]